jgi:hypothetical protein
MSFFPHWGTVLRIAVQRRTTNAWEDVIIDTD